MISMKERQIPSTVESIIIQETIKAARRQRCLKSALRRSVAIGGIMTITISTDVIDATNIREQMDVSSIVHRGGVIDQWP